MAKLHRHSAVIVGQSQTAYRFLLRLSEWYPFDVCKLIRCTVEDVADAVAKTLDSSASGGVQAKLLRISDPTLPTPGEDEIVASLSDEIRALYVRPGGNIDSLLKRLISKPIEHRVPRRICILKDSTNPDPTHERLIDAGALSWLVVGQAESMPDNIVAPRTTNPTPSQTRILSLPDIDCAKYVSHFTRSLDRPLD